MKLICFTEDVNLGKTQERKGSKAPISRGLPVIPIPAVDGLPHLGTTARR